MAAAAFVAVPFAMDDSAADGDLLIAPLIGDDDMEEYELPAAITGEITIPAGYYVTPKDDYTMAALGGVTSITFSAGSQLRIDAMSSFSMDAVAGFLYFEAGSSIAFTVLDEGYAMPVKEKFCTILSGKFTYDIEMGTGTYMVFDAKLTISDGAMITYNKEDFFFNCDTTLTAEVNIEADLKDFDPEDLDDVPMHVLVNAKLTCGEIIYYPDGDHDEAFVTLVKGSYQSYYLEASNPTYLKADKATLDMEVSGKFVLDIDGTEATITDEADLSVVIKTGEKLDDIDISITGNTSYELDVDDYSGDILTIRDIAISSSAKIDDEKVSYEDRFQIDELSIVTPANSFSIKGFDYSDSMTFEANSLADIFSVKNIVKEYAYIAQYNPAEAKNYIMACTGAMIEVYFGSEMAADFAELLDQIPPQVLSVLGFEDGYILSCVPTGTTLKDQFQKIYNGLGQDPDFLDYLDGCTDYILKVTYGIDEFVAPVLEFTENLSLDYLMFDTALYDLEVSGIQLSTNTIYGEGYESETESSYDGATATLKFPTSAFEIELPAMSNYTFVDDNGITEKMTVDGDLSIYAITAEMKEYYLSFSVDAVDNMFMNYDGLITANANDKITDFFLSGSDVVVSADSLRYKVDVEIQINDIDFPEYKDIDVAGLANRVKTNDLTLSNFLAGDSFLLDTNFLAGDSFLLADDSFEGDNFLADNLLRPPMPDIQIDADVSIDAYASMKGALLNVNGYRGMYYTVTFDEFESDVDASFADDNLDATASLSYENLYARAYSPMAVFDYSTITYSADKIQMEGDVIADNIMAVDVTGDLCVTRGNASDVAEVYIYDDLKASMDYDIEDRTAELNALTFDFKVIDTGITIDFGNIACDVDEMSFHSDMVEISGIYLSKGSPLYSMGGTVENVEMVFDGLYPQSYRISAADITFTGTNGYLVWKQTVDGNGNHVNCEVDGTFLMDRVAEVPVVYNMITPVILGGQDHYSFTGEGMAVTGEADFSEFGGTEMAGTAYVNKKYTEGDELSLDLEFHGCALGFDDRGFLTIRAMAGFTLDPTTYDGFTVNSDGYVVIDPEIVEAGEGFLFASATGDMFNLTIDGVTTPVHYGAPINIPKDENFLGMFNENGDAVGDVILNNWCYDYYYLGDMTLTSVTTVTVTATPDEVVKLTTDKFNFVVPEAEFDFITYDLPSGMIVSFASEDLVSGEAVRAAVEETKYEGKDAFMIHSDHTMTIEYAVSGTDVTLYHVMRGIPVPMSCMYYVDENGQTYAVAELTSYSTYYFDEKGSDGSKDNTYFYLAAIAIAIIVVAALCVPLYLKKKRTA
ncbi:MAG: hypothetical protein II933_01475 [Candidatus Methanomethylophilaceae archaeon]|nr:hypothetical protein [Candidatus Methanomethylophilaceae archaeon]